MDEKGFIKGQSGDFEKKRGAARCFLQQNNFFLKVLTIAPKRVILYPWLALNG